MACLLPGSTSLSEEVSPYNIYRSGSLNPFYRMGSSMPALDCSDTIKLAARPTANTVNEPTDANHGHANAVPNLAKLTAPSPARTPVSAASCFTRWVKIPRRKTPRRMPETKEAIARALLTTLSSIPRTGLNETFPILEDCGRSMRSSARRSSRWFHRTEADDVFDSYTSHRGAAADRQ